MLPLLAWYLTLQVMALAGLPIAFATLRQLPSRGYSTAKALGVLLTGVVFWWGSTTHLWENTYAAALTALGLVLAGGLLLMHGKWSEVRPWWRRNRRHILIVEGLFLVAFMLWAVVRSAQPQLQTAGGEKWMEIAFLNANLRAPLMPPHDPWLSGFAISYYYLGYLLLALLTRLSLVPSTIAFNLGNAGWFALVAVQAYGTVYDMLGGKSLWRPFFGPLMVLITGNGQGLLEVLHARGLFPDWFWAWLDIRQINEPPTPPFTWIPQRFNWWWQASRTIHDRTPWGDSQEVIDEFPAFSFILGDMHPHLLALPFVLIAVALALNLYLGTARASERESVDPRRPWRWRLPRWGALLGSATVLGALGFLNTWDFPIYWALFVGAGILGRYAQREQSLAALIQVIRRMLPEAVLLGVLSVLLYAPFWIALRSQAGGLLPNLFNATKLQQFVVMFLPLLLPMIGVISSAARKQKVRWLQALGLGIGLMVGIALLGLVVGAVTGYPYLMIILRGESIEGYTLPLATALTALQQRLRHPWTGLLLALGLGVGLWTLIHDGPGHPGGKKGVPQRPAEGAGNGRFALLLVLFGALLTLAPEFVYLQDIFMTRMNTIFKFYCQAWILWGLAGAWQMAVWLGAWRRPEGRKTGRGLLLCASGLLIAAGLVYTALAVPARAKQHGVPWDLDGAAWLAQAYPGDYAAIQWLNANVEGAPVIVEAPGDQHRAYIYEGRVAALTGLPTLLGWGGHQRQWRGNYDEPARREIDLERLFQTLDSGEAQGVLEDYAVTYVYIGPLERQRYSAPGLEKFDALYPAVYDHDGVVIYKIDPSGRAADLTAP